MPARAGGGSLCGEGGEEVVQRLPAGVLLPLELLDVGAVLLDLVLLLAELLQVAPAQVGPQPGLALRDRLQLPLLLADLSPA